MVAELALAGLVGALLALVLLASRQSRLTKTSVDLQARLASGEREIAAARRLAAQSELDRQLLARVVRELPHVAHELHAGRGSRQIPRLLLAAIVRLLEPEKAVVAIRQRPAESDPDHQLLLAVAATFPEGCVAAGTEIPIGRGEIGYAAEVQRVMDRRDFENQPPTIRSRLREETDKGCVPDLVAPMVVNEEVVGIVALEGGRRFSEAKDALRLLAQVGALSVHSLARYSKLTATASMDGLTGIFNKHYLTHRLADELRRAQDEVTSAGVFLFDVDNFKHYNDRNGHVAGDRLLQALAKLVGEKIRRDAIFGRYGGEEFLIVFPGAKRAQALAAAENIRKAVAAHDFPFGRDQPLGVLSISGGVAEYPLDGGDAVTLVRAADEALYQAKRSGRNRVVAYEPTYLGEEEALAPVEDAADIRERAALQPPTVGQRGEAVTVNPGGATEDAAEEAPLRSAPTSAGE